ncbi:NUDIX hydrolase [Leucobacter massiliensis]|uniref:Coenzyme A pyrophosphatase n=1 Tax=Leucobacter massiliensis TaxID=1686285 RepID=A0A2S9QNV0_9MICO|nr:CoA pyrophosphatase [Leucobacter massiliensis]PRI11266.1 coenzyme A pyrophosphatase [Leucobacter massiliensis]
MERPSAEQDLRELMRRGALLDIPPQGPLAVTPRRRSAVLILFGALDRLPASAAAPTVSPELDVLLTRRADRMRHHAGQIAFPGGGAEAGDSGPAATALREAEEETGLDPAGVEVLGALPEVHIPVSNNLVTPVVGWWRLPSAVAADHAESVEVFRVPVAELLDPAARGTSVLSRAGFTHRGAAFRLSPRLGGHIVWGFTGILLATLFEQLGWERPWDRARTFEVRG